MSQLSIRDELVKETNPEISEDPFSCLDSDRVRSFPKISNGDMPAFRTVAVVVNGGVQGFTGRFFNHATFV